MPVVPFIGIFTAFFVFPVCVPKRISDAPVTFTVLDEEGLTEWGKPFDSLTSTQHEMQKCLSFTENFRTDGSSDISPCISATLATRSNPDGKPFILGDQLQLGSSGFNSSNRLIILTHGFFQSRKNWMEKTKKALLNYENCNVLTVDWSALSMSIYYPLVVEYALKLADYLAHFIDFFVDEGTLLENIHLVGHSLGAHVAGVASQRSTKGIVGRISGLDAARPLFVAFEDELKLDKSDADFVDCIHTSGGFVGMATPYCHADFFVNGGKVQPGCPEFISLGRCGHLRATKYFVESISHNIRYNAYKCATMSYGDPVTCWEEGAVMGYPADESHQGIFYVETGVRAPFHTAPSKRELEQSYDETLNPLAWVKVQQGGRDDIWK